MALVLAAVPIVAGVCAAQSRPAARVIPAKGPRHAAPTRPAPGTLAELRARWPVHGPINSGFGTRGAFWGRHFHAGVDIGARRGTPIHAPAAGTVEFAGWRGGYGRTVVIDHGGRIESVYGHLSKLDVRPHQKIAKGAEIGLAGATGNASGPHLHYEVHVNGHPVNPRDTGVRLAAPSRPLHPSTTVSAGVGRNSAPVLRAGRSGPEPRQVHTASRAPLAG